MQRRTFLTGLAAGASATAGRLAGDASRSDAAGGETPSDGASPRSANRSAPRPAVVGRTITPIDDCVEPGTAAVWLTDASVVATGGLRGPTGCSKPALEDVRYDVADDALTVVVATEDAGETCAQTVTELAYRLELRLDGDREFIPGGAANTADAIDASDGANRPTAPPRSAKDNA